MKDSLVTSTACTSPDVPSTPECSASLAFKNFLILFVHYNLILRSLNMYTHLYVNHNSPDILYCVQVCFFKA